jgi:hypothetical protein
VVPVEKQKISLTIVSIFEDNLQFFEFFGGDESCDLSKICHFWFLILLLIEEPLVELESLVELKLRQNL